jgi:Cd2+/Zn2+-exporting ATPase
MDHCENKKNEEKDISRVICDDCKNDGKQPTILTKKNLTIASGILFGLAYLAEFTTLEPKIILGIYILSILAGGIFVFRSALNGLFKQRFLNINFLVSIASIGALYIGQYAEAAAVIFFFMLAEFFEDFGVERSRRALETLIKKSPKTAILANGKKVQVEMVKIGDVVIVRPGDMIPLDGKVIKGLSSVDEATITGESVPADKRINDSVFAGTLNLNGYLEIEVIKESKDSTFSKIIDLVEKAQTSRAPAQEFLDRFAKYYTPVIVGIALLIATVPPFLFSEPFGTWLYRALVLLVIACPCALVISTPVAIASAIGGASRKGILIKGGRFLESLSKIKAVAFDKTKTLTYGQPIVTDVVTFNGYSEEDVLADAAGIETFSSHPLSQSILEFVQEKGVTPHAMDKYQNVAGKGGKATCLVCNDLEHCIGNLKMIEAHSSTTEEVIKKVEALEKQGKTVILISESNQVMGALAISDKIRDESKQTIADLHRMNIVSAILTGDNIHTAQYVANTLGIKNVYASLLPDEKVKKIEELKNKYQAVAMVGDGVNDAPSLVTSNVGIAMGAGGSDVAIESADVALMNSNISNVPIAITLGQKTMRTIKQNITVALGVKAVVMILALLGLVHLEWAIGADSGVAILVILNSLRLFK